MHPDCMDMDAYFNIHNGADITNLDSLQQLRSASSQFWIENCPQLKDITGLRNMKTFNQLRIVKCDALTSLHGLEQVRHISSLEIANNAALANLTSFDSLESVGSIAISDNPALVGPGHFPHLKTVDSNLSFTRNDALSSFDGAFPLVEYLPQLTVDSCANFVRFSGLDHLRTVNHLQIWRNHKLQNFDGLDSLRCIRVLFSAQDMSSLRSFEGMPSLDSVQNLTVRRNANLESLPGLPKNGCVNGQLTVQDCPRLKSFEGMEGSVRKLHNLRVSGCDSLRDLRGLDSLRFMFNPPPNSLSGAFSIYKNALLESLYGLGNLDSSALGLGVWDCPNFQTFEGLQSLRFLNQLAVHGCPRLKNMQGLEALRFLPNGYFVYENDSLETLDGIGPVIGGGNSLVSVHDNPRLSKCDQLGICNMTRSHLERALEVPFSGAPTFANNLPGCNHYAEVLDSCAQGFSGFSGRIFMDAECDTLPGGTIVNLPHQIVRRASDGVPVAATNIAGTYFAYAPPGEDLTLKPTPIVRYHVAPDSHLLAATALPSEHLDLNFQFCPDFHFNDLQATLTPWRPPVPGFAHRYRACIENRGTKIYDGFLTLDLSSQFDNYLNVIDLNGGLEILPNVVTWKITDLPQFKTKCFTVKVELAPGAPIGEVLPAKLLAEADPLEPADIDLSNNQVEWSQRIVASYDPNDKTVLPEAINLEVQPDNHRLQYVVRFQNTGTAPATFIEVLDTLEAGLDIRTFELRSTSHNCRMSFPADSVVKWRFDNINLPDSTSNEAASHGFIHFTINTIPGIQPDDTIKNRVGIYFDFNPVVLTNFANTVFYLPVSTAEAAQKPGFRIFPNPVSGENDLNVALGEDFTGEIKFEILSLDGRVLDLFFREKTEAQISEVLEIPAIAAGPFLVRISHSKGSAVQLVLKL